MAATNGQSRSAAGTAEAARLASIGKDMPWRRWGTYLSDRQWGTVREDYSPYGTAWDYLPHDHARSRAYRWGEDGIGGFGDDELLLCLGLALWNGKDPILKERLFGLTNSEGNHGEDVKELYYYLDGTPTHSYMRMLYKYPQAAFPYSQLVEENRRRGKDYPEFKLIDTGVFAGNRYFDVEIEYAKADPEDILMQVTVHNRAAEPASLHVLPQLWARNIWSWAAGFDAAAAAGARRQRDLGRSPAVCRRCGSSATAAPNFSFARTRPTCGGCGGWRRRGNISRTASTTMSSTATAMRSTRRCSAPRPPPIIA